MGEEFLGSEVKAGIESLRAKLPEDTCEEAREQFDVAADAVRDIIYSGALGAVAGRNERKFRLALSGHANTNHMPDPDWANDSLMISISQVNPE
jgi:hypothetical protein